MSAAKDFDDFDELEEDNTPSYTFKLGGREWHCRQPEDVHWDTVEVYLRAQATKDYSEITTDMDTLFSGVLFPDEIDDFLKLKHDPKGGLSSRRINPLAAKVVERVLNRPTKPSASSSGGRPKKDRTSKADSSSQDTEAQAV